MVIDFEHDLVNFISERVPYEPGGMIRLAVLQSALPPHFPLSASVGMAPFRLREFLESRPHIFTVFGHGPSASVALTPHHYTQQSTASIISSIQLLPAGDVFGSPNPVSMNPGGSKEHAGYGSGAGDDEVSHLPPQERRFEHLILGQRAYGVVGTLRANAYAVANVDKNKQEGKIRHAGGKDGVKVFLSFADISQQIQPLLRKGLVLEFIVVNAERANSIYKHQGKDIQLVPDNHPVVAAMRDSMDEEERCNAISHRHKGSTASPVSSGDEAVLTFLREVQADMYFDAFVAEEVDFPALLLLDEADLKSLNIPMGPRKKILNALAVIRQQSLPQF